MPLTTPAPANYEAVAREAMQHARQSLPTGASNRPKDVAIHVLKSVLDVYLRGKDPLEGSPTACVPQMRKEGRRLKANAADRDQTSNPYRSMLIEARNATRFGCGNCREHSIIAFLYLVEKGIHPLDWMCLQDPGDHAFVVIGRTNGMVVERPDMWPRHVWVCDPWKGENYPGSEILKRWTHPPKVLYRCD